MTQASEQTRPHKPKATPSGIISILGRWIIDYKL